VKLRTWDIFCRVIDNHGDLGVCWRLARQLAETGHSVRLWIDRPEDLRWMAPQGHPRVEVHGWDDVRYGPPGEVVIEAFGCELPSAVQAAIAQTAQSTGAQPVWINLEYLSAEAYVARQHRLPSPVLSGAAKGCTKWFFFPGFTPDTGGLLREPDLPARQARFQPDAWLAQLGLPLRAQAHLISLFCYEPAGLPAFWQQLGQAHRPVDLLVTPGRATAAIEAVCRTHGEPDANAALRVHHLPWLPQPDFDHLLWSCDLNLVRGEDSLVRALWAGQAFVWQIYPQDDDAHHAKLTAFLDQLQAPATLRQAHATWNGLDGATLPALIDPTLWTDWATHLRQARARLWQQTDLATQLIDFCAERAG